MSSAKTASNGVLLAVASSMLAGVAIQGAESAKFHAASSRHQITNQQSKIKNPHGYADLQHSQKIVVALHETIRLMAAIDQSIEAHGGWPGAFEGTSVNRGEANA
jgi:hypothetical protein